MGNNDLTLEKLKIDERLRKVELDLAEAKPIREQILEKLEKIDKSVEKLDHKINGNGTPGIESRLKDIENAEGSRKKAVDTVVKAALTSMVMGIGSFIYWLVKSVIVITR